MQLYAASANYKKACKAYATWLSRNESKFYVTEGDFQKKNRENYKKSAGFTIADLDKNGVPELITSHSVGYKIYEIYVYTYRAGKVVQIKGVSGKKGSQAAITASCVANGHYYTYTCRKKHLHVDWGGYAGFTNTAYVVKNGKLKEYAYGEEDSLVNRNIYRVNGKSVSKKKYNSVMGKCKADHMLWENTKANRKKYLK